MRGVTYLPQQIDVDVSEEHKRRIVDLNQGFLRADEPRPDLSNLREEPIGEFRNLDLSKYGIRGFYVGIGGPGRNLENVPESEVRMYMTYFKGVPPKRYSDGKFVHLHYTSPIIGEWILTLEEKQELAK